MPSVPKMNSGLYLKKRGTIEYYLTEVLDYLPMDNKQQCPRPDILCP